MCLCFYMCFLCFFPSFSGLAVLSYSDVFVFDFFCFMIIPLMPDSLLRTDRKEVVPHGKGGGQGLGGVGEGKI